jgi:hypothetical protein
MGDTQGQCAYIENEIEEGFCETYRGSSYDLPPYDEVGVAYAGMSVSPTSN